MSKWIHTTLNDICRSDKGAIISGPFGSNISSKFFVLDGVPVIRGNNLSLSLDKFYDDDFVFVTEEKADELNCYAEEGDLIFTAAGTIGQVGILEAPLKYKKYVISNKQLRARIDTRKVDLLYAYYHEDRAALLHDIICLANNRADRDTYLILGVRDKTFEIMGVENDPHRRNQQNIVDFLSQKEFAGQIRPRVEVRTIRLEGHEVDVFIIKNSTDVPYYLTESYTDKKYKPDPPKKGKTVQAFHIYTRVMDNNTPIDKSADIRDVEYLWKKRFGLLQTPLEQVKILLRKPDEWAEEDSRYYHKLFPQYTISIEYEEDEDGISKEGNRVFYHHLQTDTRTQYGVLKIYHYSTQLFSCQITELDGHRMTAPCPETKYIPYRNYSDPNICLRYYVTSDFLYLLLRFLEYHIGNANGNEAQYATRRLLDVVLLFDSNEDAEDFATYIHRHLGTFDSKVLEQREPYIANETDMAAKALAQEIRNSQALKEMQPEWELFRLENA